MNVCLERNWTLSTYYAGILTNFVALVLTLAAPRLFLIVQRIFEVYWVKPRDISQGNSVHQHGTTIESSNHEPNGPLPGDDTDVAVVVENSTDLPPDIDSRPHNEPEAVENTLLSDSCKNILIWELDSMLIKIQFI